MGKIRYTRLVAATALIASAVFGLGMEAASADPQKSDVITLTCDGYDPVTAAVFSNGAWSPALDLDSNAVYHPVGFGASYFELRDAETGDIIFEESDDTGIMKKGQRNGQEIVRCDYVSEFSGFDPEYGGDVEGSFGGVVYGVVG